MKQMTLRLNEAKAQKPPIHHERKRVQMGSTQVAKGKLVGVYFVVQRSQKTMNLTQFKRFSPVSSLLFASPCSRWIISIMH